MSKLCTVDIPSQTGRGGWWEWGTYDTIEEAIIDLRRNGINVDDDGKLQLLTVMKDDGDESKHYTEKVGSGRPCRWCSGKLVLARREDARDEWLCDSCDGFEIHYFYPPQG